MLLARDWVRRERVQLEDRVQGRSVLLFDDLFRSGATMNAITSSLYDQGTARDVYALTLTRTRSKQ